MLCPIRLRLFLVLCKLSLNLSPILFLLGRGAPGGGDALLGLARRGAAALRGEARLGAGAARRGAARLGAGAARPRLLGEGEASRFDKTFSSESSTRDRCPYCSALTLEADFFTHSIKVDWGGERSSGVCQLIVPTEDAGQVVLLR